MVLGAGVGLQYATMNFRRAWSSLLQRIIVRNAQSLFFYKQRAAEKMIILWPFV
jgi:hypothetical protein